MSKSRDNAIAIAASEDETAQLLRAARTDSQRHLTYDPDARPEVSNLLLLTALCEGTDPQDVAREIGAGGASALKRRATGAVNEMLRPVRRRRAELISDRPYLREVLRTGSATAHAVAQRTLQDVAEAMHSSY